MDEVSNITYLLPSLFLSSIASPPSNTTHPFRRGHGTYTLPSDPSQITASLAGTLTRTNKLLSTTPLRSRYVPSIGDLVVGRIVSVEKSRWKVDIAAPLLATLPLSSINLPGGLLRRRTTADELQMRKYLQEGDLLVAEVGEINRDGTAGLHTRSLKYGKLREGMLVVAAGQGAGAGGQVVRGRRQMFTLDQFSAVRSVGTAGSGEKVGVILGVNGYVWLNRAAEEGGSQLGKGAGGVSISNLDDAVSSAIYSSQNESIDSSTRGEIALVGECIRALVDGGIKVDADTLSKAYEAASDMGMDVDDMTDDTRGAGIAPLDDAMRKRIVDAAIY